MKDTSSIPPIDSQQTLVLHIENLVAFALHNGLIQPLDIDLARNTLIELFDLKEPAEGLGFIKADSLPESPVPLLEPLLDAAAARGLIPDNTLTFRDLFDARIMGFLMPRPSETNQQFQQLTQDSGAAGATDWFYKLNIDSNYIRMDRIRKNGYWKHPTADGELEITINLSKPEKDPREIALLKTLPKANYPQCLLCKENVGYAGRPDHPPRQNLRIIPLSLKGESWFFQYSPYVYYNEHSIVFCGEHTPMKISPATFERLLDFVEQFPHYFIGSNADLPIVGGSILNHDHFQAGRHVFPMETASVTEWHNCSDEPSVAIGIVEWPMSVLRLRSSSRQAMLKVAADVLAKWRSYSDSAADIIAYSDKADGRVEHNTITPIARIKDNTQYELDLVLRNNRTSEEHPDGIFHPHQEHHHIKKENIGLIEVMGLAVLPGRLQSELGLITDILAGHAEYDEEALTLLEHPLQKHALWINELVNSYGTDRSAVEAMNLLQDAVGDKFHAVLQDAGVYKSDAEGREAFRHFLNRFVTTDTSPQKP
jgi:UDPglucose--hexose-1-phosphate uridylyltransferase